MSEVRKTGAIVAGLVMIAAVCGSAAGVMMYFAYSGEPENLAPAPACKTDEGLKETVDGLRQGDEELRGEINSLRMQVADLAALLEGAGGQGRGLRAKLPPPYVDQVDRFFKSPAAVTLLSAKNQQKRNIRFEAPGFLSPSIISVPYMIEGQAQFMIVSIKILDYYDLQFDVLWDSIEGERTP